MRKRIELREALPPVDLDDLIFGDDIWLTSDR